MGTKTQPQRSPWIVPIIVAIIGTVGVIGAAVLPGLLEPGRWHGADAHDHG
jgi:hypothetical protein